MMNVYSFEISSDFGFFQWRKTKGDKRVTNLFISKTDVLGILGAVIGLDGYSQNNFRNYFKSDEKETFYEALTGLDISIVPLKRPEFVEDHLIHRDAHFVNVDGALKVEILSLKKPGYKIFISQGKTTEKCFKKIVNYLNNGWSTFIPYLGKNNYPLEITNFEGVDIKEVKKADRIDSLFLEKTVTYIEEVDELTENEFLLVDGLKFFVENNAKIKNEAFIPKIISETMIWTNVEVEVEGKVFETKNGERITFY